MRGRGAQWHMVAAAAYGASVPCRHQQYQRNNGIAHHALKHRALWRIMRCARAARRVSHGNNIIFGVVLARARGARGAACGARTYRARAASNAARVYQHRRRWHLLRARAARVTRINISMAKITARRARGVYRRARAWRGARASRRRGARRHNNGA